MSGFAHITAQPLTGALGAEVSGVDLSGELNSDTVRDIRNALLRYGVIFFRDQALTPNTQKRFGRYFGELNIDRFVKAPDGHPEIMPVIKEVDDKRGFAGMWHSDVTFLEEPALGSILYAREIPSCGGDTLFSNMYLAYESLSPGMQALLRDLQAVHCAAVTYLRSRMDESNTSPKGMKYTDHDPNSETAVHPVVRTHPETGRQALYVNCAYTQRFEGMTEEESRPLLDYLYQHLGRPEFSCRFRWKKGSVAFWDNRCTQHLPVNDFSGERREMHRIAIRGDRPV